MAGAFTPTTFVIIGGLLALVGLLLAFLGRKLWTPFMSFVGAILGGSIGYFIAVYYGTSNVVALILAVIGSILGSILFNYLVKIALALITAAIPAYLTYRSMNANPQTDQAAQDPAVIAAILVLVAVFAIAYYFVEELIGIVTALVGAFLLGAGVFLATGNPTWAVAGAAVVFLAGATLQTLAIRAKKKGAVWRIRRRRAAATAPAAYAYTPPPSPPQAASAPPPSPPPSSSPATRPPPPPP